MFDLVWERLTWWQISVGRICLCCAVQDGRNAEIAAIRSGYADVVEIVTGVNSVCTIVHHTCLLIIHTCPSWHSRLTGNICFRDVFGGMPNASCFLSYFRSREPSPIKSSSVVDRMILWGMVKSNLFYLLCCLFDYIVTFVLLASVKNLTFF